MSSLSPVRIIAEQLLGRLEPLSQLDAPAKRYPQLAAAVDDCLDQLRALNLWGKANQLPSSELWNVAGHLLARGWLQHRARTKPRGYAGDYEILCRMYERRVCGDPLGSLFDRYFLAQAAPRAVRNRMEMMARWIVEAVHARRHAPAGSSRASLRIAVVGSAFGLEVRDALLQSDQPPGEPLDVVLADIDPAAIDFAREQLSALLPPERLTLLGTNLFRLPERPRDGAALERADLLFCPGLLDYLNDDDAARMLRFFYQCLAPGGRLVAFQFAPHDPTRAYMEWFANWYLVYRDLAAFQRVAELAVPPDAPCSFGTEPAGVDLFATITKP